MDSIENDWITTCVNPILHGHFEIVSPWGRERGAQSTRGLLLITTLNNLNKNWHEISWSQGKLIGVVKLTHYVTVSHHDGLTNVKLVEYINNSPSHLPNLNQIWHKHWCTHKK